ncbi:MAG: hypothetical protein JSW34_03805 [Candidatus Zixiibacteriota bacterium]|nr:MAG: hypothetical protein JSW34_03805 [candidate division Zixibacteria bacterium]
MRDHLWLYPALFLSAILLLSGCVKTEKRTTKKVDASKVEVYEYDPDKPRIRIVLAAPEELRTALAGMLYVEIDDGVNRYGLPGGVCAPDSVAGGSGLYSPWVNTPDSGEVGFAVGVLAPDGANIIADEMSMPLAANRYWEVTVGVFSDDPCADPAGIADCRDYALPRDLQTGESDRFYVIWRGHELVAGADSSR